MIKLIIVFTLFSSVVFAKDFTAEDARNLTKQRVYDINYLRIKEAAEDGRCETSGYVLYLFSDVVPKLKNDGYKVSADQISWCD